jgi:hypothetical protein
VAGMCNHSTFEIQLRSCAIFFGVATSGSMSS